MLYSVVSILFQNIYKIKNTYVIGWFRMGGKLICFSVGHAELIQNKKIKDDFISIKHISKRDIQIGIYIRRMTEIWSRFSKLLRRISGEFPLPLHWYHPGPKITRLAAAGWPRGGRQPSPGFIPRLFRLFAPRQGPYRASPGLARLARVGALIFLITFQKSI